MGTRARARNSSRCEVGCFFCARTNDGREGGGGGCVRSRSFLVPAQKPVRSSSYVVMSMSNFYGDFLLALIDRTDGRTDRAHFFLLLRVRQSQKIAFTIHIARLLKCSSRERWRKRPFRPKNGHSSASKRQATTYTRCPGMKMEVTKCLTRIVCHLVTSKTGWMRKIDMCLFEGLELSPEENLNLNSISIPDKDDT